MIKIKIFQLLHNLVRVLNIKRDEIPEKKIEKGVEQTVEKYKRTLRILEMYDRGQISTPRALARYSSVRAYLRDVQKGSSSTGRTISAA
jgi:hypothetical protein